jgi:hypothetical protein
MTCCISSRCLALSLVDKAAIFSLQGKVLLLPYITRPIVAARKFVSCPASILVSFFTTGFTEMIEKIAAALQIQPQLLFADQPRAPHYKTARNFSFLPEPLKKDLLKRVTAATQKVLQKY